MAYNKQYFYIGKFFFALLFFTQLSVSGQSLNTTVYFAKYSVKYHINKNCGHLKNATTPLQTISLKEAIDGEKTNGKSLSYCKTCSKQVSSIEFEYKNGKAVQNKQPSPSPETESSKTKQGSIGKGDNIGKYKNK